MPGLSAQAGFLNAKEVTTVTVHTHPGQGQRQHEVRARGTSSFKAVAPRKLGLQTPHRPKERGDHLESSVFSVWRDQRALCS